MTFQGKVAVVTCTDCFAREGATVHAIGQPIENNLQPKETP